MMPNEESPQEPAWSYEDLGLLIAVLVPGALLAAIISKMLFSWIPQKGVVALLGQILLYAVLLGSLRLLLSFKYELNFWAALGWRFPFPRMVQTLAAGPVLAIVINLLALSLKAPRGAMELEKLTSDRASLVAIAIGATTLGPLVEELLFRGFVQPLLVRSFGLAAGILMASLSFALMHGPQYRWSWQHVLVLILASAVFGYVRQSTRSTAASTLLHAAYNFTNLMALLWAGDRLDKA